MQKIIRSIKKRILKFHPLLKKISPKVKITDIITRSFVSQESRYVYFRIPKAANSTIVNTLAYYDRNLNFNPNDSTASKTKEKYSNFLLTNVFTQKQLHEKYFLFTFVRNPYSRVLSAYLDKILDKKEKYDSSHYKKYRNKMFKFSNSKKITFENFVIYLENGGLYDNPHWTPQLDLIPVDIGKLDFIGKQENLEDDINHITLKLFNSDKVETHSKLFHETGANNLIKEYYTKELQDKVYTLYKDDFDSFKYDRDIDYA